MKSESATAKSERATAKSERDTEKSESATEKAATPRGARRARLPRNAIYFCAGGCAIDGSQGWYLIEVCTWKERSYLQHDDLSAAELRTQIDPAREVGRCVYLELGLDLEGAQERLCIARCRGIGRAM